MAHVENGRLGGRGFRGEPRAVDHSLNGQWSPPRKRDSESRADLSGIRDWCDSEGWFPPSGDFDSPLPPLARPPLFGGQRPLRRSPGKIHRFLGSQPLSLSPDAKGRVAPGQAARRGAMGYMPEVRGKKGSKGNAGGAGKGRPGQRPWFPPGRAEEKGSMRESTPNS
jgi:hypothetical protein